MGRGDQGIRSRGRGMIGMIDRHGRGVKMFLIKVYHYMSIGAYTENE